MKNKYRFHLLGLAHLPQARRYSSCAFTQKNLRLAKMLTSLGHEVFFYGSEGSDVSEYCNSDLLHFVKTHTLADIRRDYGEGDNRFELGYDHTVNSFKNDFNTERKLSTIQFYSVVIDYLKKHKKPDDFLLITQGMYQRPISDTAKLFLTCESGVGYRGSFAEYRAFESSYIQNFTYGSEHPRASINGNYYDRIIPNYFDSAEFGVAKSKKDYYLFIGRLIQRKGVWTAIKATEALGARLILAGQQDPEIDPKKFPKNCEFIGSVNSEQRKKLMGEAIATFVPSIYLEPFAGVHIESMLCGTPPITTNFGVFPDTIPNNLQGIVGYRCNTLQDFVTAAKRAKENTKNPITRQVISRYAHRFTMDVVAKQYQKWFEDLHQLYLSATIKGEKGWHHLHD